MAKVVVLKIESNGTVKAIPTEFDNDREAHQAIKESGCYVFCQAEDIVIDGKPTKAAKPKKTDSQPKL